MQLATFSSPAQANQAAASLKPTGVIISQRTDAKGQTIIDDGPFSTYADAKKSERFNCGKISRRR